MMSPPLGTKGTTGAKRGASHRPLAPAGKKGTKGSSNWHRTGIWAVGTLNGQEGVIRWGSGVGAPWAICRRGKQEGHPAGAGSVVQGQHHLGFLVRLLHLAVEHEEALRRDALGIHQILLGVLGAAHGEVSQGLGGDELLIP